MKGDSVNNFDLKNYIGNRIRTLRRQKGMTQEDLERIADLPQKYVYKLERQHPNITIDTLEKVIQALDSDFPNFFDITLSTNNQTTRELLYMINDLPKDRQEYITKLLISILKEIN